MFSRWKRSLPGRKKRSSAEKEDLLPAVTVTEVKAVPPEVDRGHYSLSAVDEKRAHLMRHEAFAFMQNSPLTSADGFWTAKNSSRQSLDNPGRRALSSPYGVVPTSADHRPQHRRIFSASATPLPLRGEVHHVPQIAASSTPPTPRPRSSSAARPPLPSTTPTRIPRAGAGRARASSLSTIASTAVGTTETPLPQETQDPRVLRRKPSTRREVEDDRAILPSQRESHVTKNTAVRPPITALHPPIVQTGPIGEARPLDTTSGVTFDRGRPAQSAAAAAIPRPDLASMTMDQNRSNPSERSKNSGEQPLTRPAITALQAPAVDAGPINEARPIASRQAYAFERPATVEAAARLAAASKSRSVTYTESSVRTAFQDLESQKRSASWSSFSRPFQQGEPRIPETMVRPKPQPHPRQALFSHPWKPIRRIHRREWKTDELFSSLPAEVLELVLHELRQSHVNANSMSCATCWMRDCCSLALANRKWSKLAREALYEDIEITGTDSPVMNKRCKVKDGGRLVLLRRTLRRDMHLASLVYSLKVPEKPVTLLRDDYDDLVASIVMSCPNLERVVGYYPAYRHEFSRISHALSTRRNLRAMNWILDPPRAKPAADDVATISVCNAEGQAMQTSPFLPELSPLHLPQPGVAFVGMHAQWKELTILNIHCKPGAVFSPPRLLSDALSRLPSLHTLRLSCLPSSGLNDASMLVMPRLRHLTLSHCDGVSSRGLAAFANSPASNHLMSFTLIHIKLDSLPVLGRLFSQLWKLRTFSLVQSVPPRTPDSEPVLLFPYLVSIPLVSLHWDIPYEATKASVSDLILARSIAAGGFPNLRTLRTPHDPEGIFQGVCAPRSRCDSPSDRARKVRTILAGASETQDPGWRFVDGRGGMVDTGKTHSPRSSFDATTHSIRRTSDAFIAANRHHMPGMAPSQASLVEAFHPPETVVGGMDTAAPKRRSLRHAKSESFKEAGRSTESSPHLPLPVPPVPTAPLQFRSPSFATLPTDGYTHELATHSDGSLNLVPPKPRPHSDLHVSRLAAQARLEEARRFPRFCIRVFNEKGRMVASQDVGAFIGTIGSDVRYELRPATEGGRDETGGLVGFREMLGDCGEKLATGGSGAEEDEVAAYGWGAKDAPTSTHQDLLEARHPSQQNPGVRQAAPGYGLDAIFNVSTGQLPTTMTTTTTTTTTTRPSSEDTPAEEKVRKRKTLIKTKDGTRRKSGVAAPPKSAEPRRRPGCTGEWAWRTREMDGEVVDKKTRERLSHVERGRWRDVALS